MLNRKGRTLSRHYRKAFGLVEVITALAILALISSSVLVVINRCLESVGDSVLRMQALEVARDNMEQLLSSVSVKETTEFGESNKYPDIKWQTAVESFYEPITSRMWIRGVCSAEYQDSKGEPQKIELTHWLTDLTKEQLLQMAKEEEMQRAKLDGEIIDTIEEAAEYAGVDVETIEEWVDNGMLKTDDGEFVKRNIDIYALSNGTPNPEDESLQAKPGMFGWSISGSGGSKQTGKPPGQRDPTGRTPGDSKYNPSEGDDFRKMTPEEMKKYLNDLPMDELMPFIQKLLSGG